MGARDYYYGHCFRVELRNRTPLTARLLHVKQRRLVRHGFRVETLDPTPPKPYNLDRKTPYTACLLHVGQSRLGCMEGRGEADRNHVIPLVLGEIPEGSVVEVV